MQPAQQTGPQTQPAQGQQQQQTAQQVAQQQPTPQPQATASQQPATQQQPQPTLREIPVLPEQQDPRYAAAHAAVESAKKTKRKSRGAVAALATTSIVLAAVVLMLLAYIFKPFGLFETQIDVSQPSQFQVQAAFESGDVPYPTVSGFKYVDTNNLRMASIDQFQSTEVDHGHSHGKATATSEGRAVAHYRNGSMNVEQQLALSMSYDVNEGAWVASTPIEESITATPADIADVEAIEDDALNILGAHNDALAAVYEGAQVASEADLDIDGGTITLTFTKEQEDGSAKTCVASATVSWEQASGWHVDITEVTGDTDVPEPEGAEGEQAQPEGDEANAQEQGQQPQTPTQAQPADSSPSSASSSAGSSNSGQSGSSGSNSSSDPYGGATLSLDCYTSDLVEIEGTIQFDQSGLVLLKTDARIAVRLDGKMYITDYFEVTGTSFTNGQHLAIIGYISASGKLEQAPLMIDTNI